MGYSQLSTMHLVGYLHFYIQHVLMEQLLNVVEIFHGHPKHRKSVTILYAPL